MNKYKSLILLNVREIFYRYWIAIVLAILANTAAYLYFNTTNIYALLTTTILFGLFLLDFVLIAFAILYKRGKSLLTISRLRVSLFEEFICNSIACAIYWILFWCFEIGKATLLLYLFSKEASWVNIWANIFVWFYGNNFLHGLFPLGHIVVLLRNIAIIIGLSLSSGISSIESRYHHTNIQLLMAGAMIILPISIEGSLFGCVEIVYVLIVIVATVSDAISISKKGEHYE